MRHWQQVAMGAAALLIAGCGSAPAGDDADAPASAPVPVLAGVTLAVGGLSGDAVRGEAAFAQCRACHAVEPGRNMSGPSLHGVIGRQAGSVAGFNYSPANRASQMVWTPDALFSYLEAPTRAIPGTRMVYAVTDGQQRADIIAYLSAHK
jgi:cytochrome c